MASCVVCNEETHIADYDGVICSPYIDKESKRRGYQTLDEQIATILNSGFEKEKE
jgi:hypothetical protein